MRILALDQASYTTGFSVWETDSIKLLQQGKFTYNNENLPQRLHEIKLHVRQLLENHHIEKLYLEDIQYQQQAGVTTYKVLAELIGVLQELAIEMKIPCELIHSQTWKSTCGIRGKTRVEQKRNAQQYVKNNYNLDVTQDEADSICLGECVCKKDECAW